MLIRLCLGCINAYAVFSARMNAYAAVHKLINAYTDVPRPIHVYTAFLKPYECLYGGSQAVKMLTSVLYGGINAYTALSTRVNSYSSVP